MTGMPLLVSCSSDVATTVSRLLACVESVQCFVISLPPAHRIGCTIRGAFFALLLSNGIAFAQTHVAPRGPVKVIVLDRFWRPWLFPIVAPAPLLYPVAAPYASAQYSAPIVIPASPTYLLLGSTSTIRPQLVLNDGTRYIVTDYWREDDQLHFMTLEEGGTKFVPHAVPFDTLDLQRTKEAAKAQGFRFVIRNEPFDQWLEHHAQREKGRTGSGDKS